MRRRATGQVKRRKTLALRDSNVSYLFLRVVCTIDLVIRYEYFFSKKEKKVVTMNREVSNVAMGSSDHKQR